MPFNQECHWTKITTVNIDIFTCINIRGFMKMVNFACIKTGSLCSH